MDKEFMDGVKKVFLKLEEKAARRNEAARIELIFEEKFKPALFRFVDSNTGAKELHFDKSTICNEENVHDIRRNMDNDTINEIAHKGYVYHDELSNPSILVFKIGNLQ